MLWLDPPHLTKKENIKNEKPHYAQWIYPGLMKQNNLIRPKSILTLWND